MSCLLQIDGTQSKGLKSVVCDTMLVLNALEGYNDGNWDSIETKITKKGDENGNWEFTIKFKNTIWAQASQPVSHPGDTLYIAFDTETKKDNYPGIFPSIGY